MRRGILIVYTGDGKGKTTSALGIAIRSIGNGLKPAIIQFVKSSDLRTGEREFFERNLPNVKFSSIGAGFSWLPPRGYPSHKDAAVKAWMEAESLLNDEEVDLVILDELNVALSLGYLETHKVCETLRRFKESKYIIVTGRGAPPELIELADIATEMRKIKHTYDYGESAIKGIDF